MSEGETVERYGYSMDRYSAAIVDRLDEAFEEHAHNWTITDHSSLAINRNRHMTIKDTADYPAAAGKVPSEVFEAVREAGLRVSGVYTGVDGEHTARVWVESETNA